MRWLRDATGQTDPEVVADADSWNLDVLDFRAPAGLKIPPMSVQAGSEVLIFREYGDWGFTRSEKDRSRFVPRGLNTSSTEPGMLTVVDVARLEWLPNIYEGDTQRYLKLKMLYHDPAPPDNPRKGFMTMMCWAPPGWATWAPVSCRG